MPADLPGYRYEAKRNRYISMATGKPIPAQQIVALLRQQNAATEEQLARLTASYRDGETSPAVWLILIALLLRRQHLQNAALAVGGWQRVVGGVAQFVRQTLATEAGRLLQFGRQITNGLVTASQAAARVGMYVGTALLTYWKSRPTTTPEPGFTTITRRILETGAHHCTDCPRLYDMGWQPVGTLPAPGEGTECGSACRCESTERQVPLADLDGWLGTRRNT